MDDILTGDSGAPPTETPTETPTTPPSHAPEWLSGIEGIDAEIMGDPSLQAVNDIPNLVKSFVNAQKLIGKDKVVIPTKDSSSEEWGQFYNKIGKPSDLADYEVPFEEDLKSGYSEEFIEGFKKTAFENNLLPAQAKKVMEWVAATEKEMDDKYLADVTAKKQEAFDALKSEWGEAWDNKVNVAKTAMTEYGGDEFTNWVKETGLGGDPTFIKFLEKVGQPLLGEDSPGTGAPRSSMNMTPDEAQKAINEAMSNPEDAYQNGNHADHKRRVEEINKLFQIAYRA